MRRADHSASPPLFIPPNPSTQHAVLFIYARRLQRGSPRRRQRQQLARRRQDEASWELAEPAAAKKERNLFFLPVKTEKEKEAPQSCSGGGFHAPTPSCDNAIRTFNESSSVPAQQATSKAHQRFFFSFFSVAESSWLALQTRIPPTFAIDEKDRISFFYLGKIPPSPSPHTHTPFKNQAFDTAGERSQMRPVIIREQVRPRVQTRPRRQKETEPSPSAVTDSSHVWGNLSIYFFPSSQPSCNYGSHAPGLVVWRLPSHMVSCQAGHAAPYWKTGSAGARLVSHASHVVSPGRGCCRAL